jgi:hypothetical protein
MAKYFSTSKANKRSVLLYSGGERFVLSKHLAKKLKAQDFKLYTSVQYWNAINSYEKKRLSAYITGLTNPIWWWKASINTGKTALVFYQKQRGIISRSIDQITILLWCIQSSSPVNKYFDFENCYHHVSDDFKAMDITHDFIYIQEMLPAVTAMTQTATQAPKWSKRSNCSTYRVNML